MRFTLFIFIFCNTFLFSQNKEMSYYFDYLSITNNKFYSKKFNGKIFSFKNTKDSSYVLVLRANDTLKEAILDDHKKKIIIKFDVNFDFKTIEDLKKLNNSKLYTVVEYEYPKKYRKSVELIEYERDSLTKKTIVHLTRYKNKRKKEIINEFYYYFGNDLKNENNIVMKKYLLKKHNFKLLENENLEKILVLKNGKIDSETTFLETKSIDYKFEFPIDDVYPKNKLFN